MSEKTENIAFQIALGFIDQCEMELAKRNISIKELAEKLDLSERYVSNVFNNPTKLTLDFMAQIASFFGYKFSIVLYNDNDSENKKGPLSPNVFVECWNKCGKPENLASITN